RRHGRRRAGRGGGAQSRRPARPFRGGERSGDADAAAAALGDEMRSPFAYIPRRGPLQSARPGAAVSYLGALVVVAFLYSNPAVLLAARLTACLFRGLG